MIEKVYATWDPTKQTRFSRIPGGCGAIIPYAPTHHPRWSIPCNKIDPPITQEEIIKMQPEIIERINDGFETDEERELMGGEIWCGRIWYPSSDHGQSLEKIDYSTATNPSGKWYFQCSACMPGRLG